MPDDEKIFKLLQEDHAPSLGSTAAARIAARAAHELARSQPANEDYTRTFRARFDRIGRIPLMAATAVATIVVCLLVNSWFTANEKSTYVASSNFDREKILLSQLTETFGDRLQAVVTVNGKMQIVLSDTGVAHGQPLAIRMAGKDSKGDLQNVDIVSFSGENLQISMNGKQVDFETLVDGKGGIILAGDNLFWNGGTPSAQGLGSLSITARAWEM